MDLVQLRTFIQVAELGSLSKAADRIRIAQPALSRQIRLLEAELGVALFDRHGRGMVITERGRQLLRHAVRVLADIDELRLEAAESLDSLTGRVVIGMPPTVSDMISVPLVKALRGAHPQLELRLISAFTGFLLDGLQRGEIDVAVLYDPLPTRSIRSRPLLIENLFLIGQPGAEFPPDQEVSFSRLATQPLLLPSPRHGLRAIVDRCAAQANVTLKVDIETDSFVTLKDLVMHGFGHTILPLASISADIAAGRLWARPLIDPVPTRRLVLAFPSGHSPSRASQSAATTVSSVVTGLVEEDKWLAHLVTDG